MPKDSTLMRIILLRNQGPLHPAQEDVEHGMFQYQVFQEVIPQTPNAGPDAALEGVYCGAHEGVPVRSLFRSVSKLVLC